jgi:hypothetical protein
LNENSLFILLFISFYYIPAVNHLTMIKLSKWSKKNGVTYHTAWRWVKTGKMPSSVTVHVMPSGHILIEEIE